MSEVSACIKAHAHNSVAALEKCKINSHISLCAGMRLNVCELAVEQLACSFDSDVLNDVNALASAVVSLGRIALSVLVGKGAAHSSHYSR